MGIETEIKIAIADVAEFCALLLARGARRQSLRALEDNILLDFPDEALRRQECILRVRAVDGRGVLTYKGAPRRDGIFKSREELETPVGSPETLLTILRNIGLRPAFRYQKYRREFVLDDVCVAVDETPAGNYAELEGAEAAILALARKLEIAESLFIRKSYYTLYRDYCREKGIAVTDMLFPENPVSGN